MDNSYTPQVFMALGVGALASVFLFPLWEITLKATQFPEGLHLYIWINQLTGSSDHILQNVNRLNHYIGMKSIEPDAIPELKYFPYVIYTMMGLGALSLVINKSWSHLSWTVLLMILGGLGIYDFYLWLYDYGHNLDSSAPINIEGGSFMPPLLGAKDMANFYVTSYPSWGSLSLGLAILFGGLAFWLKRKG